MARSKLFPFPHDNQPFVRWFGEELRELIRLHVVKSTASSAFPVTFVNSPSSRKSHPAHVYDDVFTFTVDVHEPDFPPGQSVPYRITIERNPVV